MFLETLIISCHVCEDRKGIPRIVHTYDQSKNYFIERKKSFSFFLTDGGIRKKICRINGEELKTNKKRGGKKKMPRPGFEPGLLRPQRSVLTTRRSRLLNIQGVKKYYLN